MLAALERVSREHSVLIYVKRVVHGYWYDEEICDPTEPVEELIARRNEQIASFSRLSPELSRKSLSQDEKPGLAPLREEIIRYHAHYRPSRHADIIFLKKG
jgi:hypothetical protein